MNQKVTSQIREACLWAKANGHKLLSGGAWYDFTTTPWGCDALGALLLQQKLVTKPNGPEGLSGLVKATLDVDDFWLRRFWLGWDRGYQVMITKSEKDKEIESKDDVSAFGISLRKEMSK